MAEQERRHQALQVAHVAAATQGGKDQAAIERVRAWIAGEPVTARSEFGSGYREALHDITDVLDQPQQPTAP